MTPPESVLFVLSSNIGKETDMTRLKTILDEKTEVHKWNGKMLENDSIYLIL
jgi:hypothetical protein